MNRNILLICITFIVLARLGLSIENYQLSSSVEEFLCTIDKYLNIDYNLLENSDIPYYSQEQKEKLENIYRDALKRIKDRVLHINSNNNNADNIDQYEFDPPIYNSTVYDAFASKTLLNPQETLDYNPYDINDFNTTLSNVSVCGVLYPNENDRSTYYLVNYTSAQEAQEAGAYVTHLHSCGYCSTTQDLAAYMKYMDLTSPIRDCAIVSFISKEISLDCIQKVAQFSHSCSIIWLYDSLNTRKYCLDICLYDYIHHVPNNVPTNSTILNDCLACDEEKSGPVFKVVAGRTRRDSGLKSAINRPPDSIYNITHYYY
ncbi:hypothetical protein CYY_009885 [Polysphondylium violaceum]|uniref:Uncharacterized protein n=1 Tax=Polysphondylium violaceum TaxID=133409 RepID=A0A8J4PKY2_9MYCE|nr:hypothetical protein CYY_009885 [Polysphondylium violaceum]